MVGIFPMIAQNAVIVASRCLVRVGVIHAWIRSSHLIINFDYAHDFLLSPQALSTSAIFAFAFSNQNMTTPESTVTILPDPDDYDTKDLNDRMEFAIWALDIMISVNLKYPMRALETERFREIRSILTGDLTPARMDKQLAEEARERERKIAVFTGFLPKSLVRLLRICLTPSSPHDNDPSS